MHEGTTLSLAPPGRLHIQLDFQPNVETFIRPLVTTLCLQILQKPLAHYLDIVPYFLVLNSAFTLE